MKRGGGKSKGSQFERDICILLSKWWTGGERDDIFWRSTISGGRATQRAKSGKKTNGQYGDVQATDPLGKPLIDLLSVEIKRGYRDASIADLLDLGGKKKTIWHDWIRQALHEMDLAGAWAYLLIVKRDFRETIVLMPKEVWRKVGDLDEARPGALLRVWIRGVEKDLYVTTLDEFLRCVSPSHVKQRLQEWKED